MKIAIYPPRGLANAGKSTWKFAEKLQNVYTDIHQNAIRHSLIYVIPIGVHQPMTNECVITDLVLTI